MLLEIDTFCQRVQTDLDALIADLQEETARYGEQEAWAWRRSLPQAAMALDHDALKPFHIHLGTQGGVALEYRLPASSSWADLVLLGRGEDRPAAVILELKDWETSGDQPGPREGLIVHKGIPVLHPAEQVRGYVEYCRRFHSTVLETKAAVEGCVLLTSSRAAGAYYAPPHEELTREYPVFTSRQDDLSERLPAHLSSILRSPDREFAESFEQGTYQQDRSFVRQVAKAIADPTQSPFVLLDRQREGFEHCMRHVDVALRDAEGEKVVILIEGPPGSGKSVLAAHLWAEIAQRGDLEGNVVLVTTSSAQRTNMESLFGKAARGPAGAGLVKSANSLQPGLTDAWINKEKAAGVQFEIDTWRVNLQRYLQSGLPVRCPDNSLDVSIVDEAHALIDPTAPEARGVASSGYVMRAGPQAWHVMRASRVSIFLMDGDQSYRDNETTTAAKIQEFAREQGIHNVEWISLAGSQFRCAGSADYMAWLDHLLGLGDSPRPPSSWRLGAGGPFEFEFVNDPGGLDDRLRSCLEAGRSARLVASYAREWATKDVPSPHGLPAPRRDFHIAYKREGRQLYWSKIWNYAPKQDYTLFIQAPKGSPMAERPLGEVGCPYVVRGFDFDYLGVLWLSDLVWRGRWKVQLDHVHEAAWRNTKARARKENGNGPETQELIRRLQRGYRILLSRAVYGLFIWFEDSETRAHVEAMLREPSSRQGIK